MKTNGKFHYAWVICGVGTLLMICNMGLCSNIMAIYLPLIEDTGISGTAGSAIVSIRCVFSFLSTFVVTAFYKKFSFRPALLTASLLGVASALIFAVGGSVPVYFTAAAVAGVAYGFGATIPASILISRWFNKKRGLAMGIAMSGSGICTVVFSPLIQKIAAAAGIRTAFLAQAAFLALCAVLTFILAAESPEKKGLEPYGGFPEQTAAAKSAGESVRIPAGMWVLLAIMMTLVGGSGQLCSSHISILTTTSGYTKAVAAAVTSVYGLTLMLGKFVFGGFADKVGVKRATVVFMLLFILGCLPALFMGSGHVAWCYILAIVVGIGCAYFTVGTPLWAGELSSKDHYESTLRTFQLFYAFGGIIFTALPGRIADHTGEYVSSYILIAAATLISMLMLLYAYRRRRTNYGTAK